MKIFFLRPGLFLLALFCFLLPFQEFSCSNKPYIQVKAIDLAFGLPMDSSMIVADSSITNAQKTLETFSENKELSNHKIDKVDISFLVLYAFICCALAFLLTLISKKAYVNIFAGIIGIVTIALMFTYYFNQINENNKSQILETSTRFLYGFWLIISFSLLASALCLYLANKILKLEKTSNEVIEE